MPSTADVATAKTSAERLCATAGLCATTRCKADAAVELAAGPGIEARPCTELATASRKRLTDMKMIRSEDESPETKPMKAIERTPTALFVTSALW
jgi:hypothetical protein